MFRHHMMLREGVCSNRHVTFTVVEKA